MCFSFTMGVRAPALAAEKRQVGLREVVFKRNFGRHELVRFHLLIMIVFFVCV